MRVYFNYVSLNFIGNLIDGFSGQSVRLRHEGLEGDVVWVSSAVDLLDHAVNLFLSGYEFGLPEEGKRLHVLYQLAADVDEGDYIFLALHFYHLLVDRLVLQLVKEEARSTGHSVRLAECD